MIRSVPILARDDVCMKAWVWTYVNTINISIPVSFPDSPCFLSILFQLQCSFSFHQIRNVLVAPVSLNTETFARMCYNKTFFLF